MKGGKLSAKDLKALIDQSYNKKNEDYGDFKVDSGLSDPEVKVFKNDKTGQVVVAHRGTYSLGDLYLDGQYALGRNISGSRRYKHSADIQSKAEDKYGKENITTIGHSLGKKLAEVGKNSHEVIGVNGATNIADALTAMLIVVRSLLYGLEVSMGATQINSRFYARPRTDS